MGVIYGLFWDNAQALGLCGDDCELTMLVLHHAGFGAEG